MVKQFAEMEVWFVTGSQDLYGPEALHEVQRNVVHMVQGLNESSRLPVRWAPKPVVTTPEAISAVCQEANASAGVSAGFLDAHLFARQDVDCRAGSLSNRNAHLHTQFNRDIPWATIDMDFMNLNQAAHGDREFGFICTRLRQSRKMIVGHWETPPSLQAVGLLDAGRGGVARRADMKVARLGDNMRNVAVTEGDKVEAQIRLGYSVNGYGIGELARRLEGIGGGEVERLCGGVRGTIRNGPRAAVRWSAAGRAGRSGADRAGLAVFSPGWRIQGVHRHVREP